MNIDETIDRSEAVNHDMKSVRLTDKDKVYSRKYSQNEDMVKKITSHIQKIKKGQ